MPTDTLNARIKVISHSSTVPFLQYWFQSSLKRLSTLRLRGPNRIIIHLWLSSREIKERRKSNPRLDFIIQFRVPYTSKRSAGALKYHIKLASPCCEILIKRSSPTLSERNPAGPRLQRTGILIFANRLHRGWTCFDYLDFSH